MAPMTAVAASTVAQPQSATNGGRGQAARLNAPWLHLTSPAGIATSTPESTHLAQGRSLSVTSGEDINLATGRSLVGCRGREVFAVRTALRHQAVCRQAARSKFRRKAMRWT
ncbi:hypothetical protein CU110_09550 [Cobetia sp. ICG0124]|nr:hypothetical protein CU110_09550 [Cobetia sp. ICG0124]